MATGGLDWRCIFWDLSESKALNVINFDATICNICIHPQKEYVAYHLVSSSINLFFPLIYNYRLGI
jgi:hypothetical protein